MCGIAGIVRPLAAAPVEEAALRRMAGALHHRGPDGWGLAIDERAGLASTRLAMVGLADGWQPLRAERSMIAYNGEVYNHVELGAGMELRTHTDTEVVLRCLERDGQAALHRFNGQFALAWWEPEERRLTLARDRFGVRPLFYSPRPDGSLVFASEARALFASGEVAPVADVDGLGDVFTLWGARAPRTVFEGVVAVPPGGLIVWQDGHLRRAPAVVGAGAGAPAPAGDLEDLLRDAVRLRLRADVPVGAYLSGGLDSSLITALAADAHPALRTFSVSFEDPRYDESEHQLEVAALLGTEHHVLRVGPADVAGRFPDAVAHAESPLVRTAPAPLLGLAEMTRSLGITAVLTGEGADELFWGYDLFKEVQARLAGDAGALDRLYPQLGGARRGDAWRRAFLDAGPEDDPLFSHQVRANATGRSALSCGLRWPRRIGDPLERLRAQLPADFGARTALERAEWLELRTLLEPYLLSAQADRVSMAHGVEGRFPFLDHRVFEHAAALPPARKLDGMQDKVALREVAARVLPTAIAEPSQAAVPRPRGRPLLRCERLAGLGRRCPVGGGARPHRRLRPGSRCRAGPALPRRPCHRPTRGHGARSASCRPRSGTTAASTAAPGPRPRASRDVRLDLRRQPARST